MKFAPIPEFAGSYDVSECGVVRSLLRGGSRRTRPVTMKTFVDAGGYLRVTLSRPGMRSCDPGGRLKVGVHRLVALAWIDPFPEDDLVVAHLDGDKRNVHRTNLAWTTQAENCAHKAEHGTLITGDDHHAATPLAVCVAAMRLLLDGARRADVARELGLPKTQVARIATQRSESARTAAATLAAEVDDPLLGVNYTF